MYPILHEIFSDKKGSTVFSCFGIWHMIYMAVILGTIILLACLFRKKDQKAKRSLIKAVVHLAFGLYIADFFLMPFAYGEIDLEKLPFHMCTAMCVMAFLSHHNAWLCKYQRQFAVLGLVSNLIYVVYPAGVGWYQIHPLSYRVVQTLLFHGVMSAYGIFYLALDDVPLSWKDSKKDLKVIILMALWALLGNTLYNGASGDYSHMFNWFFVLRDPFYILPESIAPYLMPFVMVIVIFVAELLIYAAYFGLKKLPSVKSAK